MRKRLEENIGDQATYGPAGRSNMNHEDCKELFEAGQTLLEKSGLANFSNRRFVARNDEQIIERDWAALSRAERKCTNGVSMSSVTVRPNWPTLPPSFTDDHQPRAHLVRDGCQSAMLRQIPFDDAPKPPPTGQIE